MADLRLDVSSRDHREDLSYKIFPSTLATGIVTPGNRVFEIILYLIRYSSITPLMKVISNAVAFMFHRCSLYFAVPVITYPPVGSFVVIPVPTIDSVHEVGGDQSLHPLLDSMIDYEPTLLLYHLVCCSSDYCN
jgi:hypothetical protein